jgi:hypothetical protein
MADRRLALKHEKKDWYDETEHVLETLQRLIQQVTSPVIRTCLEEAHEDITHLTATEAPVEKQEASVSA